MAGLLLQRSDLTFHGNSADYARRPHRQVPAIGRETAFDLLCKFTRRSQHQDANGSRTSWGPGLQQIQNGNGKGCGFAGTGLRCADEVAAGQNLRELPLL